MSNSPFFIEGNEKKFARRVLQSIRCHLGSFSMHPFMYDPECFFTCTYRRQKFGSCLDKLLGCFVVNCLGCIIHHSIVTHQVEIILQRDDNVHCKMQPTKYIKNVQQTVALTYHYYVKKIVQGETPPLKYLYSGQFTLSTQLLSCNTSHRPSTTVSLEIYPPYSSGIKTKN